jgi:predicted porin
MMNRRTTVCACAALICVTPAWAGSEVPDEEAAVKQVPGSVTIYGTLDEGLQYLNHTASGNGGSVTQVGAGMNTSFFGFRGTEDLGGGLRAVWNLELGISPDTGTSLQGGRTFGRQSYVGLEGSFGRLTIGRQYTMKAFATAPINMFGTGAQGITTLDNGVANPRADNAINYRVSLTKELEVGVGYSLGRDNVSATPLSAAASNCGGETSNWKQCKEESALLKYTARNWGLESAYERNFGGTAATYGGLTAPDISDSRLILGGYRQIDKLKLAVGMIRRVNMGLTTPKSKLFWLMGTLDTSGRMTYDGMIAQLKYDDSPNKALAVSARALYALSKRTSLYVTAEQIRNSGASAISASTMISVFNPSPGGSQLSVITGIQHRF